MPTELDRSLPLFAYGTLMFPEVISAVVGRAPVGLAAEIAGYRNCAVKDHSFPGLLYAGEGIVTGVLYPGLSLTEWAKLDAFEDDFYRLQKVEVMTEGKPRAALAYIVPPENADVLTQETWDAEAFRRDLLPRYMSGTVSLYRSTEL
ncbi:hypothetical protein BH09VER1_BH09VER1_30050 [soil metagenome]